MSEKSAMKNRYAAVTKNMLTNLKSYNLSFWFLLVVFVINKSARNFPSLSLEFLIWQHFKNIKTPTFIMAILFLEHFGAMDVHIIPKRWVPCRAPQVKLPLAALVSTFLLRTRLGADRFPRLSGRDPIPIPWPPMNMQIPTPIMVDMWGVPTFLIYWGVLWDRQPKGIQCNSFRQK